MILYRYLTGPDDASFCRRVTEALNQGWQLYGNPTLAYNSEAAQLVCGQAVTKEVKGATYSPDIDLAAQ